MTRFEYLSVLVSIILALGISECLACWSRLLRHREEVSFFWLHSAWTLLALLMLVQFWWGFWQFSTVEDWSFAGLLGVVAQSAALVVAVLVITPPRDEALVTDLRAFYYRQARLFFSIASAVLVALIVVDWTVGDQPLWHPENVIRPVAAMLLAALAYWRDREWLHASALLVSGALFLLFLSVTFVRA